MNKIKLSILITLGITTFFSCDLNNKDNKDKVASFTETKYNELSPQKAQKHKIKDQQKLKSFKQRRSGSNWQAFWNFSKRNDNNKKRKTSNRNTQPIWTKNSMFELLNVYKIDSTNGTRLQEKMNSSLAESQKMRRQFYSSLSYNTTDIFNLAEIVNKLYKDPKAHDTIKKYQVVYESNKDLKLHLKI